MKMYKGFGPGMVCRGFHYEEGKTYETDEAVLCHAGFHACENPLECFDYYSPMPGVEYHEVDLDATDETEEGKYLGVLPVSKRVGKRITIGARLSAKDICEAYYAYIQQYNGSSYMAPDNSSMSVQDYSALIAGDYASLSALCSSSLMAGCSSSLAAQDSSVLKAGVNSTLCSGDASILDSEESSVLASGARSQLKAGNYSVLAASDYSELTGTSMCSMAARTHSSIHGGDECVACALSKSDISVGENSVAVCVNGKARAGLGSVIVFVVYKYSPFPNESRIVTSKTMVVDGVQAKPNVWYEITDLGEIVEAKDDRQNMEEAEE